MLAKGVGKLFDFLTDPKLGRAILGGGVETAGTMRGVPGVRNMIPATPSSPLELFDFDQYQKAARDIQGNKYFGGRSLHIDSQGLHSLTAPNADLGRKRMIGAGVMGGLLGASVLGIDPGGATSTAFSVGAFGAHAFAGSTMYKAGGVGKVLGLGYLGLLGVNTMRSGNQAGPM